MIIEDEEMIEYFRHKELIVLRQMLREIEKYDTDYANRELLVYDALACAKRAGLKAGFRMDPGEPDWPVAYIELPTGQVSWHMPQHPEPYDGHSTEEKYRRINEYIYGARADNPAPQVGDATHRIFGGSDIRPGTEKAG